MLRSALPRVRVLPPPSARFNIPSPPSVSLRTFATRTHTPHPNVHLPYKSISASVALTSASMMYLYSRSNDDSLLGMRKAYAEMSHQHHHPVSAYMSSSPASALAELNDENNRSFLHAKSTEDLLMGLFVYKLCTFQWLVDSAPHLIHFAESVHLEKIAHWVVKNTFFRHFCGGETPEECVEVMDKLSSLGMNAILDLSVEADESPQEGPEAFANQEQYADFILGKTKHCLETAAMGTARTNQASGAFAAVKVTAHTPPELLLRLNFAIATLNKSFHDYQVDGKIDAASFRKIVNDVLPAPATSSQLEERNKLMSNIESLDFIEYTKILNLYGPTRDVWWSSNDNGTDRKLMNNFDLAAYDRLMDRMDQVCGTAHRLGAGVMIDAEQSYFQEAIDHVALNMQAKYNRRDEDKAPTVYNTYQMYTKASLSKLEIDVERAHRENFAFAAKLVRGAYMVSERKRALENNYPSPIHDTLEDTHASYNNGVVFLLSKLREHQDATGETLSSTTAPIVFMVATHNRQSVILTVEEMDRQGVLPRSGVVHFGQLFSMKDQLSYALARNGYSIYKYLPYGLIQDVIPYLIRRAQENSAVLGDVGHERELMFQEVKDRVTGKTPNVMINSSSASAPAAVVDDATASADNTSTSPAAEMSGVAKTA